MRAIRNKQRQRVALSYLLTANTFIARKSSGTCTHFSRIGFGVRDGQAHLSSPQQETHQNARFPHAYGNQMGTCNTQPPPEEGPQAPDRKASEQILRRLKRAATAATSG